MPRDSNPPGMMRLFGVTIAPGPAPDPPDRDPSPNPPLAAKEDVMRKCKGMGNLAAAGASADGADAGDGYHSDDGLMQSSRKRRRAQERKKAVPWTEEEHRTFLAGLEKLGKGDWRGIAKVFVTSRTPTQVASHAQKYFLRQTNPNKKRRSSLFDMMPGVVLPVPNCHMLSPSGTKVHDVVAMTKQLQNSKLEGVSSSNTANEASRVVRDPPPIPSFKGRCRTPFTFTPIPRAPEGTSSVPADASIVTKASQTNMTTFLSPKSDHHHLPQRQILQETRIWN